MPADGAVTFDVGGGERHVQRGDALAVQHGLVQHIEQALENVFRVGFRFAGHVLGKAAQPGGQRRGQRRARRFGCLGGGGQPGRWLHHEGGR